MNLSNAARSQLSRIPGLNKAIDFICARANVVFSAEHDPDTGEHTDITADSITLYDDLNDANFNGNVWSSLIPTVSDLDLGAVISRPGADPIDHPWRDLRLSRKFYIGAAWEQTVIEGIPTLEREANGLVINNQAQSEFKVTGSALGAGSTTGTLTLGGGSLAWNGPFYERSRNTAMGEWTAVTYAAGNFTASAGTWTVDSGDQTTYAYTLVGKTMTLAWVILTTDVSNASVLRLAIPGGFAAARAMYGVHRASDNGGASTAAVCLVNASGTYVELYPDMVGNNWTVTAADNTSTQGIFVFEVQ